LTVRGEAIADIVPHGRRTRLAGCQEITSVASSPSGLLIRRSATSRSPRRADLGRALNEPAGVLDTSVFIAREVERPLGELPARVTVSVVTIGEPELGVLSASDGTAERC